MTMRVLAVVLVALSLSAREGVIGAALPSPDAARAILERTTRHREWVQVTTGFAVVGAFVVYPQRADKAPAVIVIPS